MSTGKPEFCARCARQRQAGEYGCPECRGDAYVSSVLGSARPRNPKLQPLGGVLGSLVALPPGAVVLLHGPRGVGKTQIALQALERPWFVSAEMTPERLLSYAKRIKSQIAGCSIAAWSDEAGMDMGLRPGRWNLVFDSLTATGHPKEALAAVRAHTALCGSRAVVIAQQNKEGDASGPAGLGFDVDVEIRLDIEQGQRRIVVEKNRFGPEKSLSYALGKDGPVLPVLDRYYSVEGESGRYRLVSWPSKKHRYGAYLEACEASRNSEEGDILRLPAPPCAVSALKSALYPGGWCEPQDLSERIAFAELHGIKHYSPCKVDHGNTYGS